MTQVENIRIYTTKERRRYRNNRKPDGYLESDVDYVRNNLDACVAFLDTVAVLTVTDHAMADLSTYRLITNVVPKLPPR